MGPSVDRRTRPAAEIHRHSADPIQDRLSVEIDVAPSTLSALVPNMILQPLVENAIRHGIGPRRDPGHVRIITRQVFDELWMEICDDGIGLTRFDGSVPPEGVGLRNTRAACNSFTTTITA